MDREAYNKKFRDYQKHYTKSYIGYLRKRYWNMARRVRGTMSGSRYLGLPICTLEDFLRWSEGSVYSTMFYAWKAAGHPRALAPTVDRIRPTEGYVLENLQWLTHKDNTSKGCFERRRSRKSQYRGVTKVKRKWQAHLRGTRLGSFDTEIQAAKCYLRHARVAYRHLGLPPETFELPGTMPDGPTQD